jgi:hypothetical protein
MTEISGILAEFFPMRQRLSGGLRFEEITNC